MFQFYALLCLLATYVSGYRLNNPQFRRFGLLLALCLLGDFKIFKLWCCFFDLFNIYLLGIPSFTVVFRLEPVVTSEMCGTVFLFLAFEITTVNCAIGSWSLSTTILNRLAHMLNGNIHPAIIFLIVVLSALLLFPGGLLYVITGGDLDIFVLPFMKPVIRFLRDKIWFKLPHPVRIFFATISSLITLVFFVVIWCFFFLANVLRPSFWYVPTDEWNIDGDWYLVHFGLLNIFDAPLAWLANRNMKALIIKYPAGAGIEPGKMIGILVLFFPNSVRYSVSRGSWIFDGLSWFTTPWTPIASIIPTRVQTEYTTPEGSPKSDLPGLPRDEDSDDTIRPGSQ